MSGATASGTAADPPRRHRFAVLAAVIVAGLLILIVNADLPIVRNGFMYAKAARHILQHGSPLPVVKDAALSYGKPIGFSLLCLPLNLVLGENLGMKAASYLGTSLFAVLSWLFFTSANRRLGIDPRYLWLEMALLFFNPLLVYQFWSAYPDGLFAAEVLAAFLLTERIASDRHPDARLPAVLLGLVIYASILTKLYGLVLGLACPVVLIGHWIGSRGPRAAIRAKVAWTAAVFAVLGVGVVSARMGWNPTIDLGGGGSAAHSVGVTEMTSGLGRLSPRLVVLVLASWVVALWVNFGISLLLLSWRRHRPSWPPRVLAFVAVFLIGLVPFGIDIVYNMRYIIPLFPFLAVAIACGAAAAGGSAGKRVLLGLHFAAALALTLYYNVRSVHAALAPLAAPIETWVDREDRLENLRMGDHLKLARQIALLNREVEPHGTLYWLSSYGRNATHGVIEDLGLRHDIEVYYGPLNPARSAAVVYLAADVLYPPDSPRWIEALGRHFVVHPLGDEVVRLGRYVSLLAPREAERYDPRQPLPFWAEVDPERLTPETEVEFLLDGKLIAVDREPPFETTWSPAIHGRHEAWARVKFAPTFAVASRHLTFFVGVRALERSIVHCADDGEEVENRGTDLVSSDLELVDDGSRGRQTVGLRFRDVPLPIDARIVRAYVQFTAYGASTAATELNLHAELDESPRSFEAAGRLGARRLGTVSVRWSPLPWTRDGARGVQQRTPDLAAAIQEVVNLPGWKPGNPLSLLVRGRGKRVARSCDGSVSGQEPMLYIEYEPGGK